MHDPTSLFRFQEHDVFLPMNHVRALDDNKKGMSEVGAQRPPGEPLPDEISEEGDIEAGYSSRGKSGGDAASSLFRRPIR